MTRQHKPFDADSIEYYRNHPNDLPVGPGNITDLRDEKAYDSTPLTAAEYYYLKTRPERVEELPPDLKRQYEGLERWAKRSQIAKAAALKRELKRMRNPRPRVHRIAAKEVKLLLAGEPRLHVVPKSGVVEYVFELTQKHLNELEARLLREDRP